MSSTITETEIRAVPQSSAPELLTSEKYSNKRDTFTRTTSIEKLRNFNSYICSQHYYILPSLILWLKTSQNILTSNMEKCIAYVKSMFLICTIRECLQDKVKTLDANSASVKAQKFAAFYQLSTKDILPIVNLLLMRIQVYLTLLYEDFKHLVLVASIYLGVLLVFCQMIGCAVLMGTKIPPWGFVFLVGCVLFMAKIASQVMFTCEHKKRSKTPNNKTKSPEERQRIRKQLKLIGKTISNVKLF